MLYCFVDFRKDFNTIPRDKLWTILEETMVPPELRIVVIQLYENVVSKLKTHEGRSKDIKCNIRFKQGYPLSPTLFGIYIDMLEECMKTTGCSGPELASMVINLLLYVDDIILLARSHDDLNMQLKILHDY